jgi:lysozyme
MATVNKVTVGSAGGLAAAIALISPFIQQREGYVPHPYRDIAGVLSVCNGHTGPDIVMKTYTKDQCNVLTEKDITTAGAGILKITPGLDKKPYVMAATISFAYNVGLGTYEKSSVARDFKAKQFKLGCTDMLKYSFVGKIYSKGLADRRQGEYNICMKGA